MVEFLKDSDQYILKAAIDGLSSLAAHGMCYLLFPFMVVAELRGDIQRAIPGIVECLKHSDRHVRQAANNVLSSLAAHGMCYLLFPFDVLNHGCSGIAWRYSKSHSLHCGMSEGFESKRSQGSHQWTFKPCGAYVLPSVPIRCPQP